MHKTKAGTDQQFQTEDKEAQQQQNEAVVSDWQWILDKSRHHSIRAYLNRKKKKKTMEQQSTRACSDKNKTTQIFSLQLDGQSPVSSEVVNK